MEKSNVLECHFNVTQVPISDGKKKNSAAFGGNILVTPT